MFIGCQYNVKYLYCSLDVGNTNVTVTDDLELKIEPFYDNATEYDLCSWHGVDIYCGPNSSFTILNDEITRGRSTKISNLSDDLICDITLYTNNGTAISTLRYQRKMSHNVSGKILMEI